MTTTDTKAPEVPTQDDMKRVIHHLVQEFIVEEKGNTVTKNNMTALTMQIAGAIDGSITIKQQNQEGGT